MIVQQEKKKSRFRLKLFLLFVGIFSVIFQIGSYSTVTEEEANEFIEQIKIQIKDIDGVGIFLHNLQVATIMIVPFGFVIGGLISFQTGWAVAASSVINPELSEMPAIALLYLTPFGVMELVAYAIAMSRSVIIVQALIKKRIKTQLKPALKDYSIVVGLLFIGGIIEWEMIKWASEQGVSLF